MKLRTNLFLIIGGLLLILLFAQWWVLTQLKQQLREEVSSTAFEVSRDTASAVILHQIKLKDKQFQQQRWEWHKKNPEGREVDIFIKLKENSTTPVIELLGLGLEETINVSQQGLDESFSGTSTKILFSMIIFMLLALILAAFFAHRLSKPLQNLVNAAKQLAKGNLGKQIEKKKISGPEEVQTAIAEFNAMSIKLKQLEEHNRQLQNSQQLNELGEIARSFAHSLRNPLNTLGLATDELVDEKLTLEKKQQLNKIVKRQIDRIDDWIKSFMSLSQHGAKFKPIKISSVIEQLVSELSGINVQTRWQLELDADCRVEGFEEEIRTILQVLLENAMEASDRESEIHILSCQQGDCCKIIIQDQGCGISENIKQKLFSPKVTSKGNGAGMGLFIAQRLVQSRYQGTLQLHNREQGGVKVELVLACKRINDYLARVST